MPVIVVKFSNMRTLAAINKPWEIIILGLTADTVNYFKQKFSKLPSHLQLESFDVTVDAQYTLRLKSKSSGIGWIKFHPDGVAALAYATYIVGFLCDTKLDGHYGYKVVSFGQVGPTKSDKEEQTWTLQN